MFTNSEIQQIKKLISRDAKIAILTHYNPDGDAIGSTLGLQHFLKEIGIESTIVVPNDFPKFLKWMPEAKKIIIADYKKKLATTTIENADVIFALDFNSPSRTGDYIGKILANAKGIKILIDHHQQPESFDFVYSDTTQPASAQMVFQFIKTFSPEFSISKEIAQCLYTGIMTDTGGFRFRSTSALTHRIVAELIEAGAEPAEITSNTWDTNTISRLHLLSLVLGRIEIINSGTVAILWIKREELKKYGFEKGDTEGFVNYGLSLMGVQMAAFFMEDLYEDFIKISFRSKKDVDVNQFARKYFNGGGHINAAGGKYLKSIEETIADFKEIIQNQQV